MTALRPALPAPASDRPADLPRRQRRHTLRWRLILFLGTVLTLTLLIIGTGVAWFVRAAEQTTWQARQREAASHAATTVGQFMRRVADTLDLVGSLDAQVLNDRPEVLQHILNQDLALVELIRLDRSGRLLASAAEGEPVLANLFTIPQSNWFLTALRGERYFGLVQIGPDDASWLVLAIPAASGNVVAARLRMDVLGDVVDDLHFGEHGGAYVVSARGRILAHTNRQYVFNHARVNGRPEYDAMRAAPNRAWHGTYTNFEGLRVVGVTRAVPNTRWTVVTELPEAEAYTTSRAALGLLAIGMLVFAVLIVLVTMPLLKRLIFDPVEALRVGADQVARHEMNYHIPITRRDEIGTVAEAFNRMVDRLREHEAALEARAEELLKLDRLKSEFLAMISHELRTPLNSVIGYAEVILLGMNGPVSRETQHDVQAIFDNGHHLLGLINDLLDLAKIEAGHLSLACEDVPVAALLEEVRTANAGLIVNKPVALQVDADPNLPHIWGDPLRLQQILNNLVSNAVKFTHEGHIRVRAFRDGEGTALAVEDSGVGINVDDQSLIFEKFRQIDGSFTRRAGGTGLGLAITRHLVELHGGTIGVESQVGRGTTFTVRLPDRKSTPENGMVLSEAWLILNRGDSAPRPMRAPHLR